MKRFFTVILAGFLAFGAYFKAKADEGMWLPLLLDNYNYAEMKRLGLKLTPEQVYSINQNCLKDAIVQMGGFCTAEVVSKEGLIFTNHHCGYDAIAEHSSVEHNYLDDGFWSKSKKDELHVPGLTVTFLKRVDDVTERIMAIKNGGAENADMLVAQEMQKIQEEATAGTHYRAEVKSMFDGNGYYMFLYETFRDIRLVGAPPSAIGKFGGDTDNWMWPRQTGDFSIFRIYANQKNEPADYSLDNKPYTPKHVLPISLKGVKDGDFTMIMGYPGSTDRYFTSYEVTEQQKILAPAVVKIMGERLEIMKKEMDKDEAVRIKLASNYASLNNTYKYFKGNLMSLNKFNLAEEKRGEEKKFQKWANEDSERKSTYGNVLAEIGALVEGHATTAELNYTMSFAAFAPAFNSRGIQMWRLKATMQSDEEQGNVMAGKMLENVETMFSDFVPETDEKILAMAIRYLYELPADVRPDIFGKEMWASAKGDNAADKAASLAHTIFKKSILVNEKKFTKFLKKPKLKTLENDPGVIYSESIVNCYRNHVLGASQGYSDKLQDLRQVYFKGMMEMQPNRHFYPDANSTMRLTYGTVGSYKSWEGKPYNTQTWGSEILEKEKLYAAENPQEFAIPQKLHDLLEKKDFGQYAQNGKLPICFLHNTDITGGNSGSPVINGNGELIGIAFDGNWESMMSDLKFQEEYVRTISVDIRYVLFVIDKYAGASNIIAELNLVK
ncbi:serine protease [bacterium]|nr:serine protease [bacterium]